MRNNAQSQQQTQSLNQLAASINQDLAQVLFQTGLYVDTWPSEWVTEGKYQKLTISYPVNPMFLQTGLVGCKVYSFDMVLKCNGRGSNPKKKECRAKFLSPDTQSPMDFVTNLSDVIRVIDAHIPRASSVPIHFRVLQPAPDQNTQGQMPTVFTYIEVFVPNKII
jgi:hypothetical protein